MSKMIKAPEVLEDESLDAAAGGGERKVVLNSGLRSDGELVQAAKAKPGVNSLKTLTPD